MNCILCGDSMYQEITFGTLFKKLGIVHGKCKRKLTFVTETIMLPYESKYIIYCAIVSHVPKEFSQSNIQALYGGFWYSEALKSEVWSVLLEFEKESFLSLPDNVRTLLFALSEKDIWLISIDKRLLYELEETL